MSQTALHSQSAATPVPNIVPLEPGDRLTRAEFERRYNAMPQLKKAELIEGIVYMPSPVRLQRHGRPHAHLISWLTTYEAATPGIIAADNPSIRLDLDNEPQPDGILLIDPACGGQSQISDDDYVVGGPELVAEITSSSVSYDLGDKLNTYRRNGVREYIVWRVLDKEIDWFMLRDGRYDRLPLDQSRRYQSETFPGLWLDVEAILRGDMAAVLSVLQDGLSTAAHQKFAETLHRPS